MPRVDGRLATAAFTMKVLKDRYEPMTNADRIRNMTDEELAKLLSTGTFICEGRKDICENMPGCEECRLAWLKAPAESEGEK